MRLRLRPSTPASPRDRTGLRTALASRRSGRSCRRARPEKAHRRGPDRRSSCGTLEVQPRASAGGDRRCTSARITPVHSSEHVRTDERDVRARGHTKPPMIAQSPPAWDRSKIGSCASADGRRRCTGACPRAGSTPVDAAPGRRVVDLLEVALPDVTDPDVVRLAVEREPPRVAQAVHPDLAPPTGLARERVVARSCTAPSRFGPG